MNRRIKILLAASLLVASLTTAAAPTAEQRQQLDQAISAYQQQDYRRAHELFLPLAQQGDATAQHSLGLLYVEGEGVPQDYARARYWFEQAAAQNDAVAQYNLGVLYNRGLGVT
ncbi:MAG: tetratricopeptide repeat protein, partial [Eikenella corrodens]